MRRLPTVCFVTDETPHPALENDAGISCVGLSSILARTGHPVTILYVPDADRPGEGFREWRRHGAENAIWVVPLVGDGNREVRAGPAARRSYLVYEFLKAHRFDIVHFADRGGLGYYSLVGRRQGRCLSGARVFVGVHEPTLRQRELREERQEVQEALECDFLEREMVALADIVWTSRPLVFEWMRQRGWPRGRTRSVMQRPCTSLLTPVPAHRKISRARELIFVGRLDQPHGLALFCDAVDRICERPVPGFAVRFLGEPARIDGKASADYIAQRASRWPNTEWKVREEFEHCSALHYLRGGRRLAVLPWLAEDPTSIVVDCLWQGIPFVAPRMSRLKGLLAPGYSGHSLVDLKADRLADAFVSALGEPWLPVLPRFSLESSLQEWIGLHRETSEPSAQRAFPAIRKSRRRPLVSVCLTHHERPHLLAQALASLRSQTHRNFEVVLVDDGSQSTESRRFLRGLEPEFRQRGWLLVRQPGRYLGAARNNAARHARGVYLLFMDDDNVAKPDALEVFDRAITTSGADILTCFVDVFRGEEPPTVTTAPVHRLLFLGGATLIGMTRNCFGDANSMIRRRVFRSLGGFSEDAGMCGEDWELFAKAVLSGHRLEIIPEALVWYRHSVGGMLNSTPAAANRCRALRPYRDALPKGLEELTTLLGNSAGIPTEGTRVRGCDSVRRVAIFGAGRAAQHAVALASRCGWEVVSIVDNNQELWGSHACGMVITRPASLRSVRADLVLVTSHSAKDAIYRQLESMGVSKHMFYLDSVLVGDVEMRAAGVS